MGPVVRKKSERSERDSCGIWACLAFWPLARGFDGIAGMDRGTTPAGLLPVMMVVVVAPLLLWLCFVRGGRSTVCEESAVLAVTISRGTDDERDRELCGRLSSLRRTLAAGASGLGVTYEPVSYGRREFDMVSDASPVNRTKAGEKRAATGDSARNIGQPLPKGCGLTLILSGVSVYWIVWLLWMSSSKLRATSPLTSGVTFALPDDEVDEPDV